MTSESVPAPRPPRWTGQPARRVEDERLLTGAGRYVDDIVLPGMLHLVAVRSPVFCEMSGLGFWESAAVPVAPDGSVINMAATPVRARAVEAALAAGAPVAEAAQLADDGAEPPADVNASAGFRRRLARVLTGRVLGELVGA